MDSRQDVVIKLGYPAIVSFAIRTAHIRNKGIDSTLAQIPLGRLGSAEEIAAQAALLISPLGGFTTGTNVVIDGGMTKRIQY